MPLVHRPFPILSIGALLAGCSSYSSPALEVVQTRVTDRTADAVVLDIAIDATNRNRIELPLREMDYSLKIDGREVFRGTRSPEAALRRLSIQTLHVPAVIPLSELPPAADASYSVDGVLKYTTPGQLAQVLFDIKVRRPSVRFSGSGNVELDTAAP